MIKLFSQPKNHGAAMLLFMIFFMVGSVAIVLTLGRSVYADILSTRLLYDSKQSFYVAEAGVEDVTFRLIRAESVDNSETLSFAGGTVTSITVEDAPNDEHTITSDSDYRGVNRNSRIILYLGEGSVFGQGIQSGNGGFFLSGNATIIGNVFSNATITSSVNALIRGDVIAAGIDGAVDGIHATGTVYAQYIYDSLIEGDAYAYYIDESGRNNGSNPIIYGNVEARELHIGSSNDIGGNVWAHIIDDGQILGNAVYNTILNGTVISGSSTMVANVDPPDYQAKAPMPIPDGAINVLKSDILSNGTVIASSSPNCLDDGVYQFDAATTTGLVFIDCDVAFEGPGFDITLTENIWISGNLEFFQANVVKDAGLGNDRDVSIIVDNESDRITSSIITMSNASNFDTNSTTSQIYLISMNNDAEVNGGSTEAIDMSTGATGDVRIYAPHGKITLGNNIDLEQVTAYLIQINNNTTVEYKKGLVEDEFRGGGGGYNLTDWQEI